MDLADKTHASAAQSSATAHNVALLSFYLSSVAAGLDPMNAGERERETLAQALSYPTPHAGLGYSSW